MSDLNPIRFYIVYPTSSILKPIYRGYKTMVNDNHTKAGITENSFDSRKKSYQNFTDKLTSSNQ
jgi:hypothetical protein